MELNGEDLHDASWSKPLALAADSAAVVVVTNGDSQHAYTVHLHKPPLPPPGPGRAVQKVEDWFADATQNPGGIVAIAGMGGFLAVGCLGLVLSRRSSSRGAGERAEEDSRRPEDSPPPDSWRQTPFYSPGVGAFMDDGDDYGTSGAEPPTPLRLDADNESAAPAAGSSDAGFDYDRRYDPRPGDAAMDAQARQWDSRYDAVAIGSSIGGDQ
jgi:hypothetical protein